MWKRGRIKGRVIRRTSEDKVGNAFGFHANIILIPVSAVEPELGNGYGGVDAFDPDGDGRSSETKGGRERTRREEGRVLKRVYQEKCDATPAPLRAFPLLLGEEGGRERMKVDP